MTVTVTVANSVPAGSLGAAFSAFTASGLFRLTGVEDSLTATPGGTQGAALALSSTKNYHRISVCATEGDSVLLPPATPGQAHLIRNDGAAGAQVFGTSPDTINGVATATGVPLGIGSGVLFYCLTAAKWVTVAGDELDGKWQVNASGAFLPNVNATYDIGNGASDPRDINLTRNAYIGGAARISGKTMIATKVGSVAHGGTSAVAFSATVVSNNEWKPGIVKLEATAMDFNFGTHQSAWWTYECDVLDGQALSFTLKDSGGDVGSFTVTGTGDSGTGSQVLTLTVTATNMDNVVAKAEVTHFNGVTSLT